MRTTDSCSVYFCNLEPTDRAVRLFSTRVFGALPMRRGVQALLGLLSLVNPFNESAAAGNEIVHEVVRHSDIADGRPPSLKLGFIGSYETAYGYSVSIGDIIAVHMPGGSSSTSVMVATGVTDNNVAAVGGVATTIGHQYFNYIYNGTHAATVGKAVLVGLGGVNDPTMYMAPASLSGAEMQVIRIKLAGTKKRPIIWMECELVNARDKANFSGIITVADYDAAIRLNEIYNPNHITREIAMGKLREAKELLDMGVYSQDQFNEVKEKYTPYVSTE